MKLALIRRPIEESYARREGAPLPGRVIWTDRDYVNREIVYLVEIEDGVEIPEIDG